MEREMLNCMFFMICGVVGFQRHAIIAHPIRAVFAECGVSGPGNHAGVCSPMCVDRIFGDRKPRFLRVGSGCCCDRGSWFTLNSLCGFFISNKEEITMARRVMSQFY